MNIPCVLLAVFFLIVSRVAVESSTIKTDEITKKKDEDVQRDAAAQLDRLALFRVSNVPETPSASVRHSQKAGTTGLENAKNKTTEFSVPIEILQVLRKHLHNNAREATLNKEKIDDVIPKAAYDAIMVERIKRGSSGSFLSGIAGKLVGGIASASSGSSSSSSSSSYGAPQSYDHPQSFNAWDFKKAVLNTLLQAVKAISGTVIALKGQIVKGGGFLISTKGKLISSAGEAISSLGRNIASSAVVAAPKPQTHPYGKPGYDPVYNGPPPSSEEFSSEFPASGAFNNRPNVDESSEESDESKPTGPDHANFDTYSQNLAALEESFGGSQKGTITLEGLLSQAQEPPRQEAAHDFGAESNPNQYESQYNQEQSSYSSILHGLHGDPSKNLANHISQQTNLDFHNYNNQGYRPNSDHYQGSHSVTNYGKAPSDASNNYQLPLNSQTTETHIQPPVLPLLPHLNPEDLTKIQGGLSQFGKPGWPGFSAVQFQQDSLKRPLFQADQSQNYNFQNPQLQYATATNPYRDHRTNSQSSSSNFDVQASVDITPGEWKDGKLFRI